MDKPKVVNGFTVMEMLVVMIIICVFTFSLSTTLSSPSLSLFVEKMMHMSVITQEKAFIEKETKEVEIYSTYALFDGEKLDYPRDIACSSTNFHFNAKGNINKGGTIHCSQGNKEKNLIFQIGSGRVRIE